MAKGDEYAARIGAVYDDQHNSARTLGAALGVTRNAVIGWYSRWPELKKLYPLSGTRINIGPRKKREPRARGIDTVARQNRMKLRGESKPPTPLPVAPDEKPFQHTLLTLPPNGCKWPSGDAPGSFTFCGNPREDGDRAYCPHHRLRSTYSYKLGEELAPGQVEQGGAFAGQGDTGDK